MINHRKKSILQQRGGTVVGIIIGLIIGLAIALVVAMAITKTSLPFLNKVGKQDKAPELTAGQATDPNKPLYGNNGAAKDAAKDFAPTADTGLPVAASKPVAPEAAALANPANPAVPAANPKPGADIKTAEPAGANSGANPTANPAAKPDNADDKWVYYLQAGAFREQADAENSKAKLALAGFEASISDRPTDSVHLYRVRIGPFNQLEAMNRIRGKLSENGIDVAVVRIVK
jgi:cell division protein FtsN